MAVVSSCSRAGWRWHCRLVQRHCNCCARWESAITSKKRKRRWNFIIALPKPKQSAACFIRPVESTNPKHQRSSKLQSPERASSGIAARAKKDDPPDKPRHSELDVRSSMLSIRLFPSNEASQQADGRIVWHRPAFRRSGRLDQQTHPRTKRPRTPLRPPSARRSKSSAARATPTAEVFPPISVRKKQIGR